MTFSVIQAFMIGLSAMGNLPGNAKSLLDLRTFNG